jgi:uncharacterized protein (TIGR03437 family)
MTRSSVTAFTCLVLGCHPASAFIRSRTSAGLPTRRTDFTGIHFVVNDQTAPGLMNNSGAVTITSDSDPLGALQAAMDAWTNVPTSNIVFAALTPSPLASSQPDREQLISFLDTPGNRSIVGDAVAVTRTFTNAFGEITDTDILFSPTLPFSTTLQTGTFDIQTVVTHELGHALGSSHSGLVAATMFFAVRRANNLQATLSPDDVAFATEVYPEAGAGAGFGSITGSVHLISNGPVPGALVAAVDPATGTVLGSITASDGTFTISQVPPGRYFVYAEPADGPVEPNQLGSAGQGANTNFLTNVLGGLDSPTALNVSAGAASNASLTVSPGNPPLNLRQGGAGSVGGAITFGSGAFVLNRGYAADVVLVGDGLDDLTITQDSISFFGAPITITGGFRRSVASGSNLPVIRFTVRVANDAPLGLATALVRSSTGAAVYSAGLRIAPPIPSFTAAGIVNGASFAPGPVVPGEIVSLFGIGLGPPAGEVGALNPGTGRLNNSLAGVSVTFNGIRAPLFFASAGQINAQVPFEVGNTSTANVVVNYQLASSAPVTIPIASTQPGIFVIPGTSQGIIQNQDGSLNTADNAVARGQAVVIYATGQGAVQPALATGALASGSPLNGSVQSVTATIGGVPAEVLFGGLTPQFVGLLQVNVIVPSNAPTGPNVPVSVNVGGVNSQANVSLAVR